MAKKVPRRPANPPTAGTAAMSGAGANTNAELVAAGVVTAGGELAAELAAILDNAIRHAVDEFLNSRRTETPVQDDRAQRGWNYARQQLRRRDYADMPFLRVIGRVLEVLLNHRGFEFCSGGDVFRVLLTEIPNQLEEHHRQNTSGGQRVDVTEAGGRRIVNGRMKRLREDELIVATVTRGSGRGGNFVLTESGQNIFDGWPPLSDIPGLELDGPVVPENRSRRRL